MDRFIKKKKKKKNPIKFLTKWELFGRVFNTFIMFFNFTERNSLLNEKELKSKRATVIQ